MQARINKLIEVINKEATCLENFMTLLTEQQEFLVNNDVKSLQKSVGKQKRAILEVERLERERIKLTDQTAASLKLNKSEANLSKLVQLVEESYSARLQELQRTLLHLYQKVERQRRKNEFLIRQSMGMVDRNMKFILGVDTSKPAYPKPINGKALNRMVGNRVMWGYSRKAIDRLG